MKLKVVLSQLALILAILYFGYSPTLAEAVYGSEYIFQSASELDYPPFAIVNSDGTADGFSVDLLKAVAQATQLKLNISVGPWHEIKQQLTEGKLDILPLVSYTKERDKLFDFTAPYLQMHGAVFVRKGENTIHSVTDLKDKEVLVMRGDTAHEYAVDHNISNFLTVTTTFTEAMQLLSSGKHDAVFCQYLMGLQLIKKLKIDNIHALTTEHDNTTLKPTDTQPVGFEQKFCFAVPEGRKDLLAHLNEGLAIVYANGTYEQLYQKWFSPILPQPPISPLIIVKYLALIILPILFLLAIFGVWYLKRQVMLKTTHLNAEIFERKLVQQEIEKNRKLLAETGSVGKVGGWELNIDTQERVWTDETYSIHEVDLSYDPNLANELEFYTPESLPIITEAIQQAIEHGKPFDLDLEIITHKKNLRQVHVIGKPDANNGKIYGFFQDISKRKQMEIALQESEQRLRMMMHQSPSVIELYNTNGLQVEVNRAYEKLWEFPASHTVNSFNILESQEVIDTGLIEYVNRAYGGETATVPDYIFNSTGETEAQGKGRIRWLRTTIYPLKDRNNNVKNIVINHEDITEIKLAEQARLYHESQLRHTNKMEAIGTLAGGIAHDFNNILAAILGYADMVKDDLPEHSSAKHQIDQVLTAGNRAKDLVKQILAFSRKEALQRVPTKANEIMTETLKLLRASIPTSIDIHHNIDPDSGVVLADSTQIHQVVMNLCTNATQEMEDEGGCLKVKMNRVQLTTEDLAKEPALHPGNYVHISVQDNGAGIQPENLDRIFDPYFTTKEVGKGTGMGLAVVVGIVKSHEGAITVESDPGKGTTFNIYLPEIEAEVQSEKEEDGPIPTGNEKILVVDDEKSVADMTKKRLERLGYQVATETRSLNALELFRSQPDIFDLIITDQTMPGLTGEQLARELISIRPDIPIIICTGYSQSVDAAKARSMGISGFIMKPMNKRELADKIRQVLDRKP